MFEVTRVTQQVSVQRIAAVTLLVIQLYMTVLREEIHIHITLTSFSIVRYVQIFVNNTCRGMHALKGVFYFSRTKVSLLALTIGNDIKLAQMRLLLLPLSSKLNSPHSDNTARGSPCPWKPLEWFHLIPMRVKKQ